MKKGRKNENIVGIKKKRKGEAKENTPTSIELAFGKIEGDVERKEKKITKKNETAELGSALCDNCKCNGDCSCWHLCPH